MKAQQLTALLVTGMAVHFFGGSVYAQSTVTTPDSKLPADAAPAAKSLTDYLKRTIKVTAAVRVRWEGPEGSNFTITPSDSYTLSRIRLGIAYQPASWVRLFAETQDSRAEFYKSVPNNTIVDPFDLRQSYVELGKIEGNGLKIRTGRQDLAIGSGRLVTSGDWSNITKSFDVLHGYVTTASMKMDVIAGSVLLVDPTRMDRNKPGEHFYVAYAAFGKLIPQASIEPYVMAKTAMNVKGKDGKLGDADTIYGGARLAGKLPAGFDYTAEAVREGGSYSDETVQAFGYATGAGWTFAKAPWHPRLNSDYVWASGSDNRKDGHHQSFDYLYGTQQPPNGLTGLFCWRNIEALRAGVETAPIKNLTVAVSYRDYWLATTQDSLYSGTGVATVTNVKATSNHVGEGVESMWTWKANSKTTVGAGIGTLTPGSYLKQSNKTTGFLYPYIVFTRVL
ncbi:conserved exported hypothetical protein [Candidatus Sulfopaludibacter sp. SbA3]|nr:conserved exported hypothetical protein [Candidatus Sulfopaludibacter sp. SbA3]